MTSNDLRLRALRRPRISPSESTCAWILIVAAIVMPFVAALVSAAGQL